MLLILRGAVKGYPLRNKNQLLRWILKFNPYFCDDLRINKLLLLCHRSLFYHWAVAARVVSEEWFIRQIYIAFSIFTTKKHLK